MAKSKLKAETIVRADPSDIRKKDMSKSGLALIDPSVSIAEIPERETIEYSATKDPNIHTVTARRKEAFPFSILLLSCICAALFAYMIYNYVLINEHTSVLADLRTEISTLSNEKNDLNNKLDRKNDLVYIEKVAVEDLGMVSADEVVKKYITIDFGDVIVKTNE